MGLFSKDKSLLQDMSSQIVTILGARGGVGATTFAVSLAKELADSSKRVLYVDFNLDRPVAYHYLGVDPDKLKQSVLPSLKKARVSLEDMMIETGYRKIKLLTIDDLVPLGSTLEVSMPTCDLLLETAASKFDVVIIDCDSNIYSEATVSALRKTDYLFVVTDSDIAMLPYLLKLKVYIQAITAKDKMQYIIQNKVSERLYTHDQLDAIGVKSFAEQYYSNTLAQCGYSLELQSSLSSVDNECKEFREYIRQIIFYINSNLVSA